MQIDDRFLSIKSQNESVFGVADCLIIRNWDCPGDRCCMVDDLYTWQRMMPTRGKPDVYVCTSRIVNDIV